MIVGQLVARSLGRLLNIVKLLYSSSVLFKASLESFVLSLPLVGNRFELFLNLKWTLRIYLSSV